MVPQHTPSFGESPGRSGALFVFRKGEKVQGSGNEEEVEREV